MKNGTLWLDDKDEPIQAHGGMILNYSGKYYWYGENKDADTVGARVDFIGISCYSSADCMNWHYEGLALKASNDPKSDLHKTMVCERPKVLYNPKNKKFIMWMHIDRADYSYARAGAAVSDSPTGPFRYLGSECPNRSDCRDMTVFQDKSGKAYLIHSSDWNKTLRISELNDDYTGFTGYYTTAFIEQEREAPAVLHRNGRYYMVTSGCTGWKPNSALYGIAPTIFGCWKLYDNPCEGKGYRETFRGQGSYLFEINGQDYFLLDHWNPNNLKTSGYSILPVLLVGDYMEITWTEEFNITI